MLLRNISSIYILNNDEILLMKKRSSKLFLGELWCAVGGHFENIELNDPKACIIRELLEETSLNASDINDLTLKYITIRKKDNEIRQQYIYFANLFNKTAKLSECDEGELHWVKINEMEKLKMSYTNTQCLEHYFLTGINDNLIYAGTVMVEKNNPKMVFTPLQDFDTSY